MRTLNLSLHWSLKLLLKNQTLNGQILLVWRSPISHFKKPWSYQLDSHKFSMKSENHGREFCSTDHLEPVRHFWPKLVPQKQMPHSSLFQVLVWWANMLEKQKKWSRHCSILPEKRNHLLSSLMSVIHYSLLDLIMKTRPLEGQKPNSWLKCKEWEEMIRVSWFLVLQIFLGPLIQPLEEDLRKESISLFQMKYQEDIR